MTVGDKVVFSPSNKISTIKSIEGFNTPPRTAIEAGWSTGFTLTEEIYVTRGEVMSHVERRAAGRHAPARQHDLARQEAVRQRARLQAQARHGGAAGAHRRRSTRSSTRRELGQHAREESRRPARRRRRDPRAAAAGRVRPHRRLRGDRPLRHRRRLRRRGRRHHHRGRLRRSARPARRGAHARLQLGSGRRHRRRARRAPRPPRGAGHVRRQGRHRQAQATRAPSRRRCSTRGRNVYMLDGKNVLLGVDNDLWVDAAQSELVRRFGEVVAPARSMRASSSSRRPTPSASPTRPPCRR